MKRKKTKPNKAKKELTYFLDHPDIHREECVGNGSSPSSSTATSAAGASNESGTRFSGMAGSAASTGKPSIASQINFGNKGK